MTKKDYVLIAKVLNALACNYCGDRVAQDVLLKTVEVLCDAFKSENSRFDAVKFTEAVYKK